MTTEPPPRPDRGFLSTGGLAIVSLGLQLTPFMFGPVRSTDDRTFVVSMFVIGVAFGVWTGLITTKDPHYPKALAILGLLPVVGLLFFLLLPHRTPPASRGFDILPPNQKPAAEAAPTDPAMFMLKSSVDPTVQPPKGMASPDWQGDDD